MTESLGIEHVTSSPHCARSNGFIERQVRTIKDTIKKTKASGGDIDMALLALRTTPIDSRLPSPAEMLFRRKIRGTLPVRIDNRSTQRDEITEGLELRQIDKKTHHDKHAKDLPPLYTGQQVTVQDYKTGHWNPAVVELKCNEPRSYAVKQSNGQTLRRNRGNIRETAQNEHPGLLATIPSTTGTRSSILVNNSGDLIANSDQMDGDPVTCDGEEHKEGYRSRSGRTVCVPSKDQT
jgi:hypothetical protein